MDKSRLSAAMAACVDNGQRLLEDAEWLGNDRFATAYALCILAQEEFAKAFLLHLVQEDILPWNSDIRDSMRDHPCKQLLGLLMEWLSPPDDEYFSRIRESAANRDKLMLPPHVADAMKLYAKKVQRGTSPSHTSYPSPVSDLKAKNVAKGKFDAQKQDALYVRLDEQGTVTSVPSQITQTMVEEERDKTKRLGDLVEPLGKGSLGSALGYTEAINNLKYILLDKRNRPFLILSGMKFEGLQQSPPGTTSPHSVTMLIQNISDKSACKVTGHVSVILDEETVKPIFFFNEFAVDPVEQQFYSVGISEEVYAKAMQPSHKLIVYSRIEYNGTVEAPRYESSAWSVYDSTVDSFHEHLTHS